MKAMLRMGKKVKESEKISRVEEVMNDVRSTITCYPINIYGFFN